MSQHSEPLIALIKGLKACESLWRPEPFMQRISPWQATWPTLDNALNSLDEQYVEHLLANNKACQAWLKNIIPNTVNALDQWRPDFYKALESENQPRIANGIPGRKWNQIQYFSQLLESLPPMFSLLDWCAGKGYLASTLQSFNGIPDCHCIEIDKSLCVAGLERAGQLEMDLTFHCCDALKPIDESILKIGQLTTALHACGGLHRSVLKQSVQYAEFIILSPCCYHLYGDSPDQRLSQTAQSCSLPFDKEFLRIPLLETVTGGERVKKLRKTEMIWRKAYEIWRQEVSHDTKYRNLSSAPKSLFTGSAEAFFDWANQQHGSKHTPPSNIDKYLELGTERFKLSEKIGLVRQGLKHYLERLIVLDLACFLEENHFHVSIQEFCPKSVTPRNLAIIAERQ